MDQITLTADDDVVGTEMLAVCVGLNGIPDLRTVPVPQPSEDEVLIKVLRSGICNTDLEILNGYMGFEGVLGHEFVGKVVLENGHKEWAGKTVVGDINLACRSETCPVCIKGGDIARNHCPNRTVMGILNQQGCHAEYIALPCSNLHEVPTEITDEAAVFCEPLAAACRILEQGLISPQDQVAILGDGKLGLLIAEVLSRRQQANLTADKPPPVVLFGRHPERMALLQGLVECRLAKPSSSSDCCPPAPPPGSDGRPQAEAEEGGEVGEEETGGGDDAARFDVVVDATGNPAGLRRALGLCRPLGTAVLKSTCAAAAAERFHAAPLVIDELRVVGSRCGPLPEALRRLREGALLRREAAAASAAARAKEEEGVLLQEKKKAAGSGGADRCPAAAGGTAAAAGGREGGGGGERGGGNGGGGSGHDVFLPLPPLQPQPPLNVEKYVTAVYPIEQAVRAFEAARSKNHIKVQLVCSSSPSARSYTKNY